MRYLALVTDYDGVIASNGRPNLAAVSAIHRVRSSGRRAILNTGRRVDDLIGVFPDVDIFDRVVAENGAVVYNPCTRQQVLLATPPPAQFVDRLKELKVCPLEVGQVIVATWLPHHTTVVRVIQEMGLELEIKLSSTERQSWCCRLT